MPYEAIIPERDEALIDAISNTIHSTNSLFLERIRLHCEYRIVKNTCKKNQIYDLINKIEELIHENSKNVQEIIKNHPILKFEHAGFVAGENIHCFEGLAYTLLQHARTQGARSTVDWILRIFSKKTAKILLGIQIYGVEFDEDVVFPNGVTITSNFRNFFEKNYPIAIYERYAGENRLSNMSKCHSISYLISDPTIKKDAIASHADREELEEKIFNTIAGLSAAPKISYSIGARWVDIFDKDIKDMPRMVSSSIQTFDGSQAIYPQTFQKEYLYLLHQYAEFDHKKSYSLLIALDRINLARGRSRSGNKAIEASICLEALVGDSEPNEITHKISVRSALILGRSFEEMKEIKNSVKKLYKLRSKTVHGKIPANITTQDAQIADRGSRNRNLYVADPKLHLQSELY